MTDAPLPRQPLDLPRPAWPRRLTALVLVLAVAAGIRLWLIAHTEVIARDGTILVQMARHWSDQGMAGLQNYTYHPGYPVSIVAVHKVLTVLASDGGPAGWDLSGQIASLLFGLAATAGVWFFAGRVFNWQVAWVAALLFGAGRAWAVLGADVLSDSAAICFQVWAAGLALVAMERLACDSARSLGYAAGVGFCVGTGYLFRPEALLACIPAVALWIFHRARTRQSGRLTLASIGVMLAGALVCAAPYMIAIGGLTRKKSLEDFVSLPAAHGTPPSVVTAAVGLSWAHIQGLWLVLRNLFEAMHPLLAALACVYLATWAVARTSRRRAPQEVILLPQPGGLFVAIVALAALSPLLIGQFARHGFMSHRYLMFPAALFASLAGAGVVLLAGFAARLAAWFRRRRPAGTSSLLVLALSLAVAAGLAAHTLRPLHEGKAAYRETGEAVGSLVAPGDFVFTDSAWILHYGHLTGQVIDLMQTTPQAFLQQIRQTPVRGETYVVLMEPDANGAVAAWRQLEDYPALTAMPPLRAASAPGGAGAARLFRVDRRTLP